MWLHRLYQEDDVQSVEELPLPFLLEAGVLERAEGTWCSWWDWTHRFLRDSPSCAFDLLYLRRQRASVGVSGMLLGVSGGSISTWPVSLERREFILLVLAPYRSENIGFPRSQDFT